MHSGQAYIYTFYVVRWSPINLGLIESMFCDGARLLAASFLPNSSPANLPRHLTGTASQDRC